MCKKSSCSYKRILFLSILTMVMSVSYFLFTIHTKWQHLPVGAQSWRGPAKRSQNHLFHHETPTDKKNIGTASLEIAQRVEDESVLVPIVTSRGDEPSPSIADNINERKETKCPDGSIYFSNELYDCDGIMKDARFKKNKNNTITPEKDDIMPVPEIIKQEIPTLSSQVQKNSDENSTTHNYKRAVNKGPKNFFLNCGGTFPNAVELFFNTYPKSSSYSILTFLPEKSYTIMYSLLPNHTVIPFEASYKNSSKNVDLKQFGADAETTQAVHQIDLSEWLKVYTREEDFVVLRIDSEDEVKILKHLIENGAIKYVDKYYSARGIKTSKQELESVINSLKQWKLKVLKWDSDMETYSDFFLLNPNHIPAPGKRISVCQQKTDGEKFALFLYSPSASVQAVKVIDLLQRFSPEDRLQLTIFLRYDMFKYGNLINMEKLFTTFTVGMYYNGDVPSNASDKVQYNHLRNKLLFVRRLFQRFDKTFQYIMTENNTHERIISLIQKDLHYSFVQGGLDVTYLTEKALGGKTISIDDTGKVSGDFLLVNIDTINTEYLVLYMVRRFAPWLLSILECDVTNSRALLNKNDTVMF